MDVTGFLKGFGITAKHIQIQIFDINFDTLKELINYFQYFFYLNFRL